LLRKIGADCLLNDLNSGIRFASSDALDRVERITGRRYAGEEWQDVLVLREFIKVLGGTMLRDEVVAAMDDAVEGRNAGLPNRLGDLVRAALLPMSTNSPDASHLDPRKWSFPGSDQMTVVDRCLVLGLLWQGLEKQDRILHRLGWGPGDIGRSAAR
jgi:hypothetical protein